MKKFIAFFLSVLLFVEFIKVPVSASDATPYYNNVIQTVSSFSIDSNGEGEIYASYTGFPGITDSVTVTIKIQKRSLGLVWTKVDIGTDNNKIVVTSTNVNDEFTYYVQLNSTGNYRAVITYEISGSGGSDDTIKDICTAEYS